MSEKLPDKLPLKLRRAEQIAYLMSVYHRDSRKSIADFVDSQGAEFEDFASLRAAYSRVREE